MRRHDFGHSIMHYHPRQLENLILLKREFRQGVFTIQLLEALGEQEKSLVYLEKQGVKVEGFGKQRQSVIGKDGKHSESGGHWSFLGDRLAML